MQSATMGTCCSQNSPWLKQQYVREGRPVPLRRRSQGTGNGGWRERAGMLLDAEWATPFFNFLRSIRFALHDVHSPPKPTLCQ